MSYYEGQEATGFVEGQDYDYSNYDYGGAYPEGGDGGDGGGDYAGQSDWANGSGGEYYDENQSAYVDGNGEYYDENGGYYDENGNYVYPSYAEGEDGATNYENGDYQSDGRGVDVGYTASAPSPPTTSSSLSSSSSQEGGMPRSASSHMLAQLASEFALDSASSSPSSSLYLPAPVSTEATTAKAKPPPPRLRNGEIPPYYDDEETGYQYYLDDDGNTQWDLVGYYEYDGEYVYYEDVETEMNTRAIEEELENYQHQYNDDEKTDKETEEERKVRHRAAVSKEIIETEKSYVESLDILVKKYMGPLVASGVLDKDERATIFSNIPSLLSINNALLRDLMLVDETTKVTPSGKSFADVWLSTVEYFKMYSVYCTNYPNALKFTQTMQKQKPQFQNFCRELKNSSASKLDLTDYLIKPELIRNTDTEENPKEYAKLLEIEKRLQQVAGHVNEAKRMAESLQSVVEIASLLTDLPPTFTLVEANRRFLFRGTYSAQVRPRMLSKQLKFVAMLWIRSIIVRDPGDTRLELEDEGVCLLIDFKEALEKEKWRSEIEDEINKALKSRPKRRQRPGELQREQSLFINKDNLSSEQMSSPRSGDDQEGDGDGEGQGSSINSYDTIHRLIEHEEERKRELDRRLLELDAREKESRERLSAVRARNADLEREIAEWQAKVQSLEGSSASAGLGSSAGGEDLGSRSSRGPLPAGFATMRKPAPGASTAPDPNFPKGPFNKRNSVLHS
ncbi:RhoGEF domain containing protein [Acanthamoeba castellanii str. Neff]|uniref:RhoGEF domain containing protein n=1 Tax=Acanthamoeba castellanii (strain ATCC 30010 / Neff) TaxID=1257118 RepID=L8H1L1_ACACF|nr:RhoGEF domain containing protein [Acanthamoeba castellanii str. Neff]ELR19115.1 RhoGEF domain containing protein [Acanthamoeba castellanii str. Neff]